MDVSFVSVCPCVSLFLKAHVHVHGVICADAYASACVHVHTGCVHVCKRYVRVCICVSVWGSIHVCACVFMHTHACAYVCIRMCMPCKCVCRSEQVHMRVPVMCMWHVPVSCEGAGGSTWELKCGPEPCDSHPLSPQLHREPAASAASGAP